MAKIKKLILENGETRYRLRYYVGRDGSGKQTVKTETFRKKRDADNRAAKIHTMKEEGVRIVLSKETFVEYLSRWLKEVKEGRVRARTLDDYQSIVRRVVPQPETDFPLLQINFSTMFAKLAGPLYKARREKCDEDSCEREPREVADLREARQLPETSYRHDGH